MLIPLFNDSIWNYSGSTSKIAHPSSSASEDKIKKDRNKVCQRIRSLVLKRIKLFKTVNASHEQLLDYILPAKLYSEIDFLETIWKRSINDLPTEDANELIKEIQLLVCKQYIKENIKRTITDLAGTGQDALLDAEGKIYKDNLSKFISSLNFIDDKIKKSLISSIFKFSNSRDENSFKDSILKEVEEVLSRPTPTIDKCLSILPIAYNEIPIPTSGLTSVIHSFSLAFESEVCQKIGSLILKQIDPSKRVDAGYKRFFEFFVNDLLLDDEDEIYRDHLYRFISSLDFSNRKVEERLIESLEEGQKITYLKYIIYDSLFTQPTKSSTLLLASDSTSETAYFSSPASESKICQKIGSLILKRIELLRMAYADHKQLFDYFLVNLLLNEKSTIYTDHLYEFISLLNFDEKIDRPSRFPYGRYARDFKKHVLRMTRKVLKANETIDQLNHLFSECLSTQSMESSAYNETPVPASGSTPKVTYSSSLASESEIGQRINALILERVKLFEGGDVDHEQLLDYILPAKLYSEMHFLEAIWNRPIDNLSTENVNKLIREIRVLIRKQYNYTNLERIIRELVDSDEDTLFDYFANNLLLDDKGKVYKDNLYEFISSLNLHNKTIEEDLEEPLIDELSKLSYDGDENEFEESVVHTIRGVLKKSQAKGLERLEDIFSKYLSTQPIESSKALLPASRYIEVKNTPFHPSAVLLSCSVHKENLDQIFSMINRQDPLYPLAIQIDTSSAKAIEALKEYLLATHQKRRVFSLSNLNTNAADSSLDSLLLELTNLRKLALKKTTISSSTLKQLSFLRNLEDLSLSRSSFDLETLATVELQARRINLSKCQGKGELKLSIQGKAIVNLLKTRFDFSQVEKDGHVVIHENYRYPAKIAELMK